MDNSGIQDGLTGIGAAGGALGMVFIVAMLIAALAPVILAIESGRVLPIVVSLSLVAAAVATSLALTTIFGNIISVLIWLGALGCGGLAYAVTALEKALRKQAEPRPAPRRATEPELLPRRGQ